MEIDFDTLYQETYDKMLIGQRININIFTDGKFSNGVIMDKHLQPVLGRACKGFVIDVLLDNGDIVEMFECYAAFYPRFQLLT